MSRWHMTVWIGVSLSLGCSRGRVETAPAASPLPTAGAAAAPDAIGRLAARGLMVPVHGLAPGRVPDSFQAVRDGGRVHAALDLLAPRGTPVLSADSGTVLRIASNSLGGRTIYVQDLAREFVHYYAHLERYLPGLFEGQRVGPGDVIGYVGTTGNAPENLPHLHYQLLRHPGSGRWWEGTPMNPHPLLRFEGRATSR